MLPHHQALDAEPREGAAVRDVFRALADEHRRFVLYYLCERPRSSVDELADVIAGRLTVGRVTITTPTRRERIRINLHHVHLPMLDDVGLVAYDRETKRAELRDLSDTAEALIERSLELERTGDTQKAPTDSSPGAESCRSGISSTGSNGSGVPTWNTRPRSRPTSRRDCRSGTST